MKLLPRFVPLSITTCAALVAACAPNLEPTAVPQSARRAPQAPPSRAASAQFALDVDPASGNVTVRSIGVGKSGRGIHTPATVVQDNNPLNNPPETFQLVTTSALLPGQGSCPGTDNCFLVRVDSFLSRSAAEVTLVVDSVSPVRVLANPDPVPPGSGLSAPLGAIVFGDILAGGSSLEEDVVFTIPTNDPYTVLMSLYEQDPGGGGAAFPFVQAGGSVAACYANTVGGQMITEAVTFATGGVATSFVHHSCLDTLAGSGIECNVYADAAGVPDPLTVLSSSLSFLGPPTATADDFTYPVAGLSLVLPSGLPVHIGCHGVSIDIGAIATAGLPGGDNDFTFISGGTGLRGSAFSVFQDIRMTFSP